MSRNLGPPKLRILEVGCGNGALSKHLQHSGHEIVAIDNSAEAIAATCRLGVDERVACFPEFDEERFDAVLFTRSLHHIQPLGPALERAHALLKPAGLLLVEDFAFADINIATALGFIAYSSCSIPVASCCRQKTRSGESYWSKVGEFLSGWITFGT